MRKKARKHQESHIPKIILDNMDKPKIVLKPLEPGIPTKKTWRHDKLERRKIAEALTNLVYDQSESLVVSLNGGWGTGKTFLLTRWQQDLKNKEFEAIYFNAWEDDFCADPLVSIIGQLGKSLKARGGFKDILKKIGKAAKPLIITSVLSVLKQTTNIPFIPLISNFVKKMLKQFVNQPRKQYQEQRDSLDQLKKCLKDMADRIKTKTKLPLVFIIDELDRCRPLFAIELLERVKHIFNVPNMVFVLGINRQELSKSVQAIYGNIDTDGYLRRFLDLEFLLPQANAQDFCHHLIIQYQLSTFYNTTLGRDDPKNIHSREFGDIWRYLPPFFNDLNLSLRDIDWCLRALAFAGKNIQQKNAIWPLVIIVLLVLRVKDMELYQRFINKACRSSEVLNRLDQWISYEPASDETRACLDWIECDLYYIDMASNIEGEISFGQLNLLKDGLNLTRPEYLSSRTQQSNPQRADNLLKHRDRIQELQKKYIKMGASVKEDDIRNVYRLIELVGQDI